MNKKRSGKFYRKNEADIMKSLGLVPTKNSGSGWIEKEDGQNEQVICQLKSTDHDSIRIRKFDIDTLERNAIVSHKVPVFAINFLSDNSVFLLIRPEDLESIHKGLVLDQSIDIPFLDDLSSLGEKPPQKPKMRLVRGDHDSRMAFNDELIAKYDKTKGAVD